MHLFDLIQKELLNTTCVFNKGKLVIYRKVCSFNYMDEEVKQWREDRKKNYPTSVKKSKEEKTSMLHCKVR